MTSKDETKIRLLPFFPSKRSLKGFYRKGKEKQGFLFSSLLFTIEIQILSSPETLCWLEDQWNGHHKSESGWRFLSGHLKLYCLVWIFKCLFVPIDSTFHALQLSRESSQHKSAASLTLLIFLSYKQLEINLFQVFFIHHITKNHHPFCMFWVQF